MVCLTTDMDLTARSLNVLENLAGSKQPAIPPEAYLQED